MLCRAVGISATSRKMTVVLRGGHEGMGHTHTRGTVMGCLDAEYSVTGVEVT